ncbi:uncharacterized protein BDR25DRAFT_355717 [Lindgomyces ingoldianus]|uniref:Uncharacterized protein n=1 Tax=Lindgomyces ingoldianus TaxID=673940 RepID=A0ACB6QSM3_9PLEO|nr:uncharacterized protein BDR25DRAFT_355717 [Lindgomyces ingoldianus]KAF2469993.1 hypothetical protein BDR25DRAFT_355717 [Lindgomyces ingoldianus]
MNLANDLLKRKTGYSIREEENLSPGRLSEVTFPKLLYNHLFLSPAVMFSYSSTPSHHLQREQRKSNLSHATIGYYSFSNIRYAQPSIKTLRLRSPVTLKRVSLGNMRLSCEPCATTANRLPLVFPQRSIMDPLVVSVLKHHYSAMADSIPKLPPTVSYNPRMTEDCPFSDVIVPKQLFEGLRRLLFSTMNVTFSIVNILTNGNDRISSEADINDQMLWVAIKYHLGTLTSQWVGDNIHRFGGDKHRVTVLGKSADAGSVIHHITAFSGARVEKEHRLFQKASLFAAYSGAAPPEIHSIVRLALILVYIHQIDNTLYGCNLYGPIIDGDIAPAIPRTRLKESRFDRDLYVMVGHDSNQGLTFTSPQANTSMTLTISLAADYIFSDLHASAFDGSRGY